jgi:hypothetical protein
MLDNIEINNDYRGTCTDCFNAKQEVLDVIMKYNCSIADLKYIVDDILNCIIGSNKINVKLNKPL